jgi:hypothetical protein
MNEVVDLLTRYGNITLEQVQAHAETYVHGVNRAAQDSMQLHLCTLNSLTKTAQASIALLKSEHAVGDPNPQVSGTCLLKVAIRKSHVDTNATTSHILKQLAHIDNINAAQSSGSGLSPFFASRSSLNLSAIASSKLTILALLTSVDFSSSVISCAAVLDMGMPETGRIQ